MSKTKGRYPLAILTGLLLSLNLVSPLADPDLWWHIVIGRWIIFHHSLPHHDFWNAYSDPQAVWRAYSWAPEILFAWVDKLWGIDGLILLKYLFTFITVSGITLCLMAVASSTIAGAILALVSLPGLINHLSLRPQVISWLCFAVIFSIAELTRRGRIKASQANVAVFLSATVWANCNITSAIGLLMLLAWGLPASTKLKQLITLKTLRLPLSFLFGTLCTPYMGGEWLTFSGKAGHPLEFITISEFAPVTLYQASALLGLSLALLIYLIRLQSGRRIPIHINLIPGVFFLGSMLVGKMLPFALIINAVVLASVWQEETSSRSKSALLQNLLVLTDKLSKTPPVLAVIVTLLLFVASSGTAWKTISYPLNDKRTMVEEMNYTLDQNLPGPILHSFGSGGYVLYRLSNAEGIPRERVVIDGRTNVNSAEIMSLANEAYYGTSKWQDYLAKVQPNTIVWENNSPLVEILKLHPDWELKFQNKKVASYLLGENGGAVFVRRDPINPDVARKPVVRS